MNETTKTILIVGAIGVLAWVVYRKATGKSIMPAATSPGTGNSVPAQTNNGAGGSANWWQNLGSIGTGISSVVGGVESTYNNVYDYFGGSTANPPAAG